MSAFSPISKIIVEDNSSIGPCTYYSISSPNMDSCPSIKFGNRPLRARSDGRYYTEDFTSFPQLFTEGFGYNSVTLCQPDEPYHPLRYLWFVPSEVDHVAVEGSIFSGLGVLSPKRVEQLRTIQGQLTARAKKYEEKSQLQHSLLHSLERSLRQCLERLTSMPCTLQDLVGQVAEYQRVFLDMLSWLDFQEIFAPRWTSATSNEPKVFDVDKTRMGAYTLQPSTLQWLYAAGIPVWFVQKIENTDYSDFSNPKLSHVILQPASSSKDWMEGNEKRPFPTVFVGPPGEHRQQALKRLGSFLASVPGENLVSEPPPERGVAIPSRSKSMSVLFLMFLLNYVFYS
jgi:hypothetical protein